MERAKSITFSWETWDRLREQVYQDLYNHEFMSSKTNYDKYSNFTKYLGVGSNTVFVGEGGSFDLPITNYESFMLARLKYGF